MKRIVGVAVVLLWMIGLSSWEPGVGFTALSPQPLDAVIAEIIEQVQESRLREHICQLQSAEGGEACNAQGSRWSCRAAAIDRALEYGRRYLERLGLEPRLDPYPLDCRPGPSYNLWAELPGTESRRLVLITAHLDSLSFGVEAAGPAPGADDNASGSAVVLEAAHILSQYRFKHPIRFVLFTGEEQGMMGSYAYAEKAAREGAQILGVFNMDGIGYDSDHNGFFEVHAGTREESLRLADLLIQTVRTYQIPLVPEVLKDPTLNRSDHAAFWNYGYPAVLIIQDTSLYGRTSDFNPHHHSPNDTLQHLNLPYLRRIAQAVIGAAAQLAEPVR